MFCLRYNETVLCSVVKDYLWIVNYCIHCNVFCDNITISYINRNDTFCRSVVLTCIDNRLKSIENSLS